MLYRASKAIYENKAMLKAATATLKTFDPGLMAEANPVPFHPGAKQFYKEAVDWPPKKR